MSSSWSSSTRASWKDDGSVLEGEQEKEGDGKEERRRVAMWKGDVKVGRGKGGGAYGDGGV
jgi:hypothetical protein